MAEGAMSEAQRQYRLVSQLLSMHATLRDRYRRWALYLDLVNLAASVVFCATAFASDSVLAGFGTSAESVRIVLGVAAAASFFVSIMDLRVDWKGKTSRHAEAVERLGHVHKLFRAEQQSDGTWNDNDHKKLTEAYLEAMNAIENIPEKLFVPLKAKHLRKVAVSRLLDDHPNCPVWILRTLVCFKAISKLARSDHK